MTDFWSYSYAKDLGERIVATAAEAFLGAVGVSALTGIDLSTVEAGAIAAAGATLSLLKGVVAKWTGKWDTASVVQ